MPSARCMSLLFVLVSTQVGTSFAWSVSAEGRQPILEEDGEVVQRLFPLADRHRPFSRGFPNGHVHDLEGRFLVGVSLRLRVNLRITLLTDSIALVV